MRPIITGVLLLTFCSFLRAQWSAPDTLVLDSMAVIEESVVGMMDSIPISTSEYQVDAWSARLIIRSGYDVSKIRWKYQTYPYRSWIGQFPPQSQLRYRSIKPLQSVHENEQKGWGGLQTNGFISRGIQLGNNQNLNVQSGMNLQLSGWLSADWQIRASLSDANIPIQPGGTSAKLEDFDQILMVLSNKKNEITGGDFFVSSDKSNFVKYNKRAQGIKWKLNDKATHCEVSTSLTKGRFARQVIAGIEGNQGPYRLVGAQGENFIIVLAGTEVVYIDGVKMNRGQDEDYVIDYNTGLLTFMPTRMITKDKRITVEFQYSDKQYIRPMLTSQWKHNMGGWEIFGGYYNEGDAKNQPLQLNLSDSAQWILNEAGDNWSEQFLDGSREADNQSLGVLYEKLDTLGFSNVWLYSSDTTAVLYQVVFSYVGLGNGDYRENGFVAGGKVYQWVAPIWDGVQWVKQGDFIDKSRLTAPNRLQVLNVGIKKQQYANRGIFGYSAEGAASVWDQNTFSNKQDDDNMGWIAKADVQWKDTADRFQIQGFYEFQSRRFQRVERFREVEFERNWNLVGMNVFGDWHLVGSTARWNFKSHKVDYQWERLQIGDDWSANRWRWKGDVIKTEHFHWKVDGWYTDSKGILPSNFIRNKDEVQWKAKGWRVFYQDEWERNQRAKDSAISPYAFLDYCVGLGSEDTTRFKWVVFYRNRWDELPSINQQDLALATMAEHWGVDAAVQLNSQTKLMGLISQRQLMVRDSERFKGQPEKTILGKLALSWRDRNGAWSLNSFYQVGSGLEQRKSFVYLEVPLGQGSFVWIDHNDDGVKDLNEFEIPAFGYEANYIRTQVPTADFVSVGTTQAVGSLQWHPKQGFGKKWSNTFNVQSETKHQGGTRYFPIGEGIADTSIVQTLFSVRDQLQWNAMDPRWGGSLSYQWNQTKSGLTLGYEWREEQFISPQLRVGIAELWSFMPSYKKGWKTVASDFLNGRNYRVKYDAWWLQVQWKPSQAWLIQLQPEWTLKLTESDGNVAIKRCVARSQFQGSKRQNWLGEIGFHQISYSGNQQGSVYYDLLEGLQTGKNFTWTAQWQTMTGKLQWSVLYNGRSTPRGQIIHTGTLQVKAVF
jgi:hypothetical protein